jgi:hypothetical protein
MMPANILSILRRVSWSIVVVSSVLMMAAAGGGVLKEGRTAKMAEMWACVMVPTDDSAAVPVRRKWVLIIYTQHKPRNAPKASIL